MKVNLKDGAVLLADGGAVGSVGKNHNILAGLNGLRQVEHGEGQLAPEADKELHCPVQVGGAVVSHRQGLQGCVVQKLFFLWRGVPAERGSHQNSSKQVKSNRRAWKALLYYSKKDFEGIGKKKKTFSDKRNLMGEK